VIAWLTVGNTHCEGVVFPGGGRFGGHSLYIKDGHLYYFYNVLGNKNRNSVHPSRSVPGICPSASSSPKPVPTGRSRSAPGPCTSTTTLLPPLPMRVQPGFFSLSSDGSNVGRDRGQPVSSNYQSPFDLTCARINHVLLKPGDDIYLDLERETQAAFRRD